MIPLYGRYMYSSAECPPCIMPHLNIYVYFSQQPLGIIFKKKCALRFGLINSINSNVRTLLCSSLCGLMVCLFVGTFALVNFSTPLGSYRTRDAAEVSAQHFASLVRVLLSACHRPLLAAAICAQFSRLVLRLRLRCNDLPLRLFRTSANTNQRRQQTPIRESTGPPSQTLLNKARIDLETKLYALERYSELYIIYHISYIIHI